MKIKLIASITAMVLSSSALADGPNPFINGSTSGIGLSFLHLALSHERFSAILEQAVDIAVLKQGFPTNEGGYGNSEEDDDKREILEKLTKLAKLKKMASDMGLEIDEDNKLGQLESIMLGKDKPSDEDIRKMEGLINGEGGKS